jgi:hypothetical protein
VHEQLAFHNALLAHILDLCVRERNPHRAPSFQYIQIVIP